MGLLVEDLLLLARLDEHRPLDREPVNLLDLAGDAAAAARATAPGLRPTSTASAFSVPLRRRSISASACSAVASEVRACCTSTPATTPALKRSSTIASDC